MKLLEGNPGKRPLNPYEPKPALVMPKRPPYLDHLAKRIWERDAPKFHKRGLLTELDGEQFGIRCQKLSDIYRLRKQVRKEGEVYEDLSVDVTGVEHRKLVKNPRVTILENAEKEFRLIGVAFGDTPSSRTRIAVKPVVEEDTMEAFIQ